MIGSTPLSALPLRERRRAVRNLLAMADSDPRAQVAVESLLRGPIPLARPIGRLVSASKQRSILLQAWTRWLQDAAAAYSEDRSRFDLKEVTARGQWIAKQLGRMRSVPKEPAEVLLDAVVKVAILALELPSGQLAERALLQVVIELRKWLPSLDDIVLHTVATSMRPYRQRTFFLRDLDSLGTGPELLLSRMRDLALRQDAGFAEYLFSAMPDLHERSRELARAIRAGCDPRVAGKVIDSLLEPGSPEYRATYLEPILTLAVETQGLPPSLGKTIIDIVTTVPADRAVPGVLSSALYKLHAALRSENERRLEEANQEHGRSMQEAQARIRTLEAEVKALGELIESVKKQAREPELQTEHRVRAASLTPICIFQQDMVLALRDRPDLRLSTLAQTLQGALTRQGIVPYGTPGEVVTFDPSQHEHARWSRPGGETVKIVAPGYWIPHPLLGDHEVLARAVVESADPG